MSNMRGQARQHRKGGREVVIETVIKAVSSEAVSLRYRELLEHDLKNPKHVAKLQKSLDSALKGNVTHWRELYPDPES
jgi:hypothetical protein